jgi:hypothetical protein
MEACAHRVAVLVAFIGYSSLESPLPGRRTPSGTPPAPAQSQGLSGDPAGRKADSVTGV